MITIMIQYLSKSKEEHDRLVDKVVSTIKEANLRMGLIREQLENLNTQVKKLEKAQ